eukprot:1848668-Rhodomonas_salina.2
MVQSHFLLLFKSQVTPLQLRLLPHPRSFGFKIPLPTSQRFRVDPHDGLHSTERSALNMDAHSKVCSGLTLQA